MPRVVECEQCLQGIRGEALQSYAMQNRQGQRMFGKLLGGDIGTYVTGSVVDGALGAGGLVAARQGRALIGAAIPGGDNATVQAGVEAGLALVVGGLAERFVPGLAGRGRAVAATTVSLALTAVLAQVTGLELFAPVQLGKLDVPREHLERPTTLGAIDFRARGETVTPPPTRVANIAGVV